ncbi:hypothetical protein PRIPAC_75834 [Pristionchus pacificus]|nr:hypothetical protein PRIPAC_75834 [Pristionchus pacificus]
MGVQEFELIDYVAPVVVGVIFSVVLFFLSVCINFTCIKKNDDITEFERWGAKYNLRMGPHRLDVTKQFTDKRFISDSESS